MKGCCSVYTVLKKLPFFYWLMTDVTIRACRTLIYIFSERRILMSTVKYQHLFHPSSMLKLHSPLRRLPIGL